MIMKTTSYHHQVSEGFNDQVPENSNKGSSSITKREIEKFWRRKKMEEEDHLLAAIKAAARIRARNLIEEDYRRFEESLKESKDAMMDGDEKNLKGIGGDGGGEEIRVGIKDWWTKSKYAYLNQPESKSFSDRRQSSYVPNNICFYKHPNAYYQRTFLGVF